MTSIAYPVEGFKQFPIAATDDVKVNGKKFDAGMKKALLRAFIARLLGTEVLPFVFPASDMTNGVVEVLINRGEPETATALGPTQHVFDAAVAMWANPSSSGAKDRYSKYQAKLQQYMFFAAELVYALRTMVIAMAVTKAADDGILRAVVRARPVDADIRNQLFLLAEKPGKLTDPLPLFMAKKF